MGLDGEGRCWCGSGRDVFGTSVQHGVRGQGECGVEDVCDVGLGRPSTASRITSSFDAFGVEEAFDGLEVNSGPSLGSDSLSSTIDSLQNMSVRILIAPVGAGGTGRWLSHNISLLGAIITSVTTSRQKGQTPVLTKAWRMFSFVRARV